MHVTDLTRPAVKYVPEWFPGAGFKKQARTWRRSVDRLLNAPYEDVQRRLVRIPIFRFPRCSN